MSNGVGIFRIERNERLVTREVLHTGDAFCTPITRGYSVLLQGCALRMLRHSLSQVGREEGFDALFYGKKVRGFTDRPADRGVPRSLMPGRFNARAVHGGRVLILNTYYGNERRGNVHELSFEIVTTRPGRFRHRAAVDLHRELAHCTDGDDLAAGTRRKRPRPVCEPPYLRSFFQTV